MTEVNKPLCEPGDMILMSHPPQYRCKHCGQNWYTNANQPPFCNRFYEQQLQQHLKSPAPQRELPELMPDYMEKFGKKLNEQESRTGDELFMWLKDKLTTETPAPQRELQAWENKHNFTLHRCSTVEDVRDFITECQDAGCIQQVAYSTYHDALTQVCFTCKVVVTNMPKPKGT